MKPLLENIDFELENTMKETTSGIPPWTHVPPKVNLDIAKRKKYETAEDVFRSNFNEIRAEIFNLSLHLHGWVKDKRCSSCCYSHSYI